MNNSPDSFYSIRYQNASVKASAAPLQSMEFRAHNTSINEYSNDILSHLFLIQQKTKPNLALIQQQPEINLKMRPLLLDFLMDVINKLQLSKSTFPLCVNLIDRYCSTRIVKKQHYQLLGLTSLWISCKNSDSKIKIPNLNDLCKMCCNCYDKKLFLEMENHLLKSLNWMISFPTFDSFVDICCKEYAQDEMFNGSQFSLKQVKYMAIYICELIQFYPNLYFNYSSSEISVSAFILSLMILNFKGVQPMTELSKLNSKFIDSVEGGMLEDRTFNTILQSLVKVLKCPPPSLKLKYFSKSNRQLNLMQLLIKFCNLNLTPVSSNPITPKNSIHKLNQLPPTPLSSNISPNGSNHSHPNAPGVSSVESGFLPSPRLSPHNNNSQYFNTSPPFTPLDIRASTSSKVRSEYITSSSSTILPPPPPAPHHHNYHPHLHTTPMPQVATFAATVPAGSLSASVIQNSTFPSRSSSATSITSSSSVASLRKRSFQILSIDTDHTMGTDVDDENLKRSKSQKPIFYIN
ncbi:G1/S-specific cyclin Cln3p [[Candida] railenensis]|uniref:G1/S-specific cyclin Cln3p n=1 Tax=[Candida] railenensis TaxID=45579 RepID=A0A9P0VWE3_9ASCO|nr:G1/S-specific cyclin Cln3p [[Candida] railenensis]